MKNRFLLLTLLLSGFAFSQNIDELKKLNGSDSLFTKKFVADLLPNHQLISKEEKFGKLSFVLIPNDASENDKSEYDRGNHCKKCVFVEFMKLSKDGNSDLNIKGIDYYVFQQATGNFLSMFPYWQKFVEPNATNKKTFAKHPLYTYRNLDNKLNLVFRRTDSGSWILRNH